MTLPTGTKLGPYEILSVLGAGGMGEVYRARDTRLPREVAIKVLPEELGADTERLARFDREARAASALNHPNVVTIYDVGREGRISYIAMELVEGKTLRELTDGGPLPVRNLLQIGAQVAEGLAKAHAAGIVHRDLKPENLMISEDGFVKILDFGLAKLAGPSSGALSGARTLAESQTVEGVLLGTVAYMSPEQASGRALDFRSDQFSLGSLLYEAAIGTHAFRRQTAVETMAAVINHDAEPMGALNPRLPAPLCWIVERCLAKDPNARYASTRDLARDLAEVRDRFSEAPREISETRPSNLPAPRSGFVGRQRERLAVRELLGRPDVRLVTLTGPGGIGKSRLGLEIARELADAFPGGVHYVPLEPLSEPGLIGSTIAQALGLREAAGQAALATLREFLQSPARAPMLLVLDGFEHLIAAAPQVSELAAAAPRLKLLVTSRSRLHVYGEHEFPVPPLAVPDPKEADAETLGQYESVALFLQRAAAARPSFVLTAESAAAVAEICARLDGLPLAIELAAARVKLLSPAALRARLESRLALLTDGARDLPARQQTLRGAIDWSHDLLDPAEQMLFRRLSVFAGGCTLEAAEAVCNARTDLERDVLDLMSSLIDKSLVQQVEPADGEPRFLMLETIREYALERLCAGGDEALARRAHAAYFLVLAEEEGGNAEEADQALGRLEIEHDNLRAALDTLTQAADAEWGMRLAAALFQFWETRDHLAEGRERLERVLKLPGAGAPVKARARVLFAAGVLTGEQGDYGGSRALLAESLEINRSLGDSWGVAVSQNALAVSALDGGDAETARTLFEENLPLWRELG
ncbi:MAG TPA: protein kinase, partial [Thermoanaerobaculia bacterium]|nr:protein kinase [Thermoanaerobaculia bacterium]